MIEINRQHLGLDTFVTYPHMNGYLPGDRGLVYRCLGENENTLRLLDFESGDTQVIWEIPIGQRKGHSWDIALDVPLLAIVLDNRAMLMDLEKPGRFEEVYRPADGLKVDGLCSISPDGRKLLTRESGDGMNTAVETDLSTGESRKLFAFDWYANHFHYCFHNPSWVGFFYEGPTEDIPDRCWVWHAEHAPEGRNVFDQASSEPGVRLCVGHEHWCMHDVSAYVPAYMPSPAGPRGMYEIFGDGRPARLIWPSDVLWHCTMDRTGRYIAVDTAGPFRKEPFTAEQYEHYLETFLRKDAANEPMDADIVILDVVAGKSLWLGTAEWTRHPYHPHPAISPNGRWVAWNDENAAQKGIWLAELSTS